MWCPLTGEELSQVEDRCLCCRIGHNPGEREVCGHACNIDDAPLPGRDHLWTKNLTRQKSAACEVEVEVGSPVGDGDALKRMFLGDSYLGIISSGGIHENCWCSKKIPRAGKEVLQAVFGGGVRFNECGRSSGFGNGINPFGAAHGIASGDNNPCPTCGQPHSDRAPKGSSSTDHNSNFVFQIKEIHPRRIIKTSRTGIDFLANLLQGL